MKALMMVLALCCAVPAAASTCFGSVSHGRLENGVALPPLGANFQAYSTSSLVAGRQFVHAKVRDVVLETYRTLATGASSVRWVYGETGLEHGGPFKPHKTHENGLSVDFFVPVVVAGGQPAILPSRLENRFGYDIEFTATGQYAQYRIDFVAMARHLAVLKDTAARHGVGIAMVIVDKPFLPLLFATQDGRSVRALPFMAGKPWVRHDEHYHVDFSLPCAPM